MCSSISSNLPCLPRTEFFFDLSGPFEIHDDVEVLKRMGLGGSVENGTVTLENVDEVKRLFPTKIHAYLERLAQENSQTA
jgi:hypothetical protein